MSELAASGAAILLVALPLGAAPLPFLLRGRGARALAFVVLTGVVLATTAVVLELLENGPQRYLLGGHAAPLGIELRVDGFAVVLIALTAVVLGAVCLHVARSAAPTGDDGGRAERRARVREDAPFWSLLLFLWASLDALYLSNDLFNLYVGLELLGLSAVGLVALAGDREALAASMRYLLVSLLGSLAYLLGVALLYAEHGSLALDLVGEAVRLRAEAVGETGGPGAGVGTWAALVAITLGLALKTALAPFHGWLPRAHASAPSAVSALLSAIVVKASFYVLLRLWIEVFASVLDAPLVQMVGALGAVAIVGGALLAIRQERLKLIVAFSTVSQIGYLFVLLPVALAASPLMELATEPERLAETVPLESDGVARAAWQGGVLYLASHAVAKASLFLVAGNILWCRGHDRVAEFAGLARRAPGTVLALAFAGVSLVGLPPSGGFVGKWLLVTAAIERGLWAWALVMLSGSVLTAVYVYRVVGATLEEPQEPDGDHRPVPVAMTCAALGLAILALALGLWPAGVFGLLELSRGFPW